MRRLVIAAGVLVPSISFAHISLTYPPPRTASQKNRVCGEANSVRGTNVTTLAPGATITVTWLETIDHPGHYRISFDADGQDFVVPATSAPGATAGMPNVLVDPIDDIQGALPAGGRPYSQQITLPDIECNNCTLQLIQMMTDKPPYTQAEPSDDIYYQCADITLSRNPPDGAPNSGPDAGAPDGGTGGNGADATGGCSTGGGAVGLPLGLVALGLVARRRRR